MECSNEKCCDIAKMIKKVAEEKNVTEKEVNEYGNSKWIFQLRKQ